MIINVPQISVDEVIYENVSRVNDWGQILRPELKSVTLMKDLVHNCSKPSDLVLNAIAGMFSSAKASISVSKHS